MSIYNDKKIIEKRWYGDKTEDNFVKVKKIGTRLVEYSSGEETRYILIELPDKTWKEVYSSELYD